MKAADWLSVIAVLLAPLVALQVSYLLQRWQEARQRKLGIFRTLMATRSYADATSSQHVQALNMIDVEFHASREIRDAWRTLLDHLTQPQLTGAAWFTRRDDLLVDLLDKMARSLGYTFDNAHIRRAVYSPQAHGNLQLEQARIRAGAIDLLTGARALKVIIDMTPPTQQSPPGTPPTQPTPPGTPPAP